MTTRLTLRRDDGTVYLRRWGVECRWAGVYLHHIGAPDPGPHLHDHPWPFVSLVLSGGYTEDWRGPLKKWMTRVGGLGGHRRRWSARRMDVDEFHRIVSVEPHTWTLVLRGRRHRTWGFLTPEGWVPHYEYDARPLREER